MMSYRKASVGATSLVASLLTLVSSACCVGPLAVVLTYIGLSTSSLLAIENAVGPFRSYILGLTFAALGLGFYSAYGGRGAACSEGQVCSLRRSERVQRMALWAASALLTLLLYFTYVHPNLDLYFGWY